MRRDAAKVNRVLDNMQLDYVKAESAQAVFDGTPSRSQKEQGEPAKAADRQAEMGQDCGWKKRQSPTRRNESGEDTDGRVSRRIR